MVLDLDLDEVVKEQEEVKALLARLPKNVYDALRIHAFAGRVSMNSLVRKYVQAGLQAETGLRINNDGGGNN